jgi:hypothetical protein
VSVQGSSPLPQRYQDAPLLPAGGVGLRYQLTQKYPMHMRLHYAWGRDGGLLYFSVGEAFQGQEHAGKS